jgi:glycerate 2-kinase
VKSQKRLRSDASRIWTAALRAVDPAQAVRKFVVRKGRELRIGGRRIELGKVRHVWVLGAGKAVAPMAQALERVLGRYLAGGIVITKRGHSLALRKIECIEAGHPLPDEDSIAGAGRIASLIRSHIGSDDLVLFALSGGGSSLLTAPAPGITLEDKIRSTRTLLSAGADIHEINAIRKHLSAFKGGGLAQLLAPTRVICLILSDVVGDAPSTIASGPLAPDSTTYADCLKILNRLRILVKMPPAVTRRLEAGASGVIPETPKPGDPVFKTCLSCVIASNAQACSAAVQTARSLGYRTMLLTSQLTGNTREAAQFHMSLVEEIIYRSGPLRRPACLISAGETTLQVMGSGRGGRNQEFVLSCAARLSRLPVHCLAASLGTDGTDGQTDAAGAIADNSTHDRSMQFGANFLTESLHNNDSYGFFKRTGDLIVTGPTRTNVMDLHIFLIG